MPDGDLVTMLPVRLAGGQMVFVPLVRLGLLSWIRRLRARDLARGEMPGFTCYAPPLDLTET